MPTVGFPKTHAGGSVSLEGVSHPAEAKQLWPRARRPRRGRSGGQRLLLSLCLESVPRSQRVSTGHYLCSSPVSANKILTPSLLVCKTGR